MGEWIITERTKGGGYRCDKRAACVFKWWTEDAPGKGARVVAWHVGNRTRASRRLIARAAR